jgi:Tol biopolymer transport system component
VRISALLLFLLAPLVQGAAAQADSKPFVLAFANDLGRSLDVYVVALGDATPLRLTSSPRDEFSPAWSPDGRHIAYRVNPPRGDEGEIWVMRADGTRKRNLTNSAGVADWSPAWSPDGRRIAYFSAARGSADVWVMRSDGGGKRNLTRNGLLNEYPSWSPDGGRLVFNSHRDGQFEVYSIRANGTGTRNLSRNASHDKWPAWSPDGRLIAFVSDRAGSDDVFVMRPDGTGVRNLTRTQALDESHAAWMPDGRLSFSRHGETGPIELWAFDVGSGEAERLQTSAEPVFVFGWKPSRPG